MQGLLLTRARIAETFISTHTHPSSISRFLSLTTIALIIVHISTLVSIIGSWLSSCNILLYSLNPYSEVQP